MNQLENNQNRRSSSAGRSRGRGSDKGTGRGTSRNTGRSSSSGSGSRSSYSYRSGGQAGRMNAAQTARRNSPHRRKKGPDYKKIAIAGVILIILIAGISLAMKWKGAGGSEPDHSVEETTETEMMKEVKVDGITITGMSKNQARNAILKEYPWNMTVTYDGDTYNVTNLAAEKVDALLDEIYSGEPAESYTLNMDGLEEAAAGEAENCAAKWNKKAKNGSIDSYDKEKGAFVFAGEENKYKTISTFTTKTTANKARNTNIRLASEALNGTVVHPGEEFSFNAAVGQRTEAKGYQGAAAYNNGEVVQEIGGGVCQVSTTLYNAVYRSGLGEESITFRRSHTFEPNYITPGQDATVSWEQPDFRFRNTSSTSIGIKASYADQKMTVSIYGIPILEEGTKLDLVSEKVEELDPPAPTYEEDQTLEPGVEIQKSAGSKGSRWITYKVLYKDGKEVSREQDHKTTYKGHAPVIRRNTTGVVLPPEETTLSTETTTPTIDGMPDGYIPGDETITTPSGNGSPESGPGTVTQPAAPTTAPAAAPNPTQAPQPSETEAAGPGGDNPVIAPLKPE
ncbi:VanW family protein [Enterocloster bolteae]|uniref:VanW family protein n=1 Tax=Enterocloster bolteae TaxID=208479 RepID=UPI00242CE31A|nr:VanW family protein [Enterocloster bolteae]